MSRRTSSIGESIGSRSSLERARRQAGVCMSLVGWCGTNRSEQKSPPRMARGGLLKSWLNEPLQDLPTASGDCPNGDAVLHRAEARQRAFAEDDGETIHSRKEQLAAVESEVKSASSAMARACVTSASSRRKIDWLSLSHGMGDSAKPMDSAGRVPQAALKELAWQEAQASPTGLALRAPVWVW